MLCLWLGFLAATRPVAGAQENPPPGKPAETAKKDFKPKLILLPIVYYSPETKLAFGAGGTVNFRIGHDKEKTRPTSLWLLVVYTLNKQFQLQVKPEIYFPRNLFLLNVTARYDNSPQNFYGIGDYTSPSVSESYRPVNLVLQTALKKKILGNFYAGIQYDIEKMTIHKVQPGGMLETGDIPGSRGGVISGLGFTLTWDSRDNILATHRGYYCILTADAYDSVLGSDFDYTNLRLDLRTYRTLFSKHVLAIQAVFMSRGGSPPFYQLAQLGGDSLMRGYYGGLYRDKTLTVLQAEYRLPVWRRFGVVGFGGLGEVMPSFGNFRFGGLRYSCGAGLRYKLDLREGTNLRLDFAWGKASHGIYVTIREAF